MPAGVAICDKKNQPHPQIRPSSSFGGTLLTCAKPSALRAPSPSVGFFSQVVHFVLPYQVSCDDLLLCLLWFSALVYLLFSLRYEISRIFFPAIKNKNSTGGGRTAPRHFLLWRDRMTPVEKTPRTLVHARLGPSAQAKLGLAHHRYPGQCMATITWTGATS